MTGAQLSGCVVKYSADRGVGIIKPLLDCGGVFCSSRGVLVYVKQTDRFFFNIKDVCTASGEQRLQSDAKTRQNALVPVIPVGGKVFFGFRQCVSSPSWVASGNGTESLWANQIRMNENLPLVSLQYLERSAWAAWEAEERFLKRALHKNVWRKTHVSDDVRLDSVTGIPIDF